MTLTLVSGCATAGLGGGRTAEFPIPTCPPETVTLQRGWLGPNEITLNDGREYWVYAMLTTDVRVLTEWIATWQSCARDRGIVIEEANR